MIHGSYHRSGLDLVLTGRDGHHHVIASYFASEHPPALAAPDGAHFSADMVELLAGSPAPHEYAQAQGQTAAAADSIGKIQKIAGDVSVQRNGVSVALNVGDVVYKSDVIVTGTDAKCGLTFPDGTALEILPNSRMALNEYDYDAKSTSNQALFTLVEGTFGFVAGKVAHTGDMKIGTPVATMGIRGTTGVVQEVNSANGGTTYSYSVYDDPGTSHSGSWDMFVDNPDGTESLALTVSQPGFVTFVTLRGLHEPRLISTVPLTASQIDAARLIINDLSELAGLAGPHSIGIPGSGDNPLLQLPPNFQPEPFSNGPNVTYNYQFLPPPGPVAPQNLQNLIFPTTTTASNVFIWSSPNNQIFPNGSFWNLGAAPISADDIVVILTGISQYTENFTFQSLTIDGSAQNGGLPPGELDMMGGGLTVTNGLDVAGTLLLQGDPPTFTSYGTSIVETTGEIIAQGAGTVVEFMPDPSNPNPAFVLVSNFGLIAAESGGLVEFLETSVTNEAAATSTAQPGLIESIGAGSLVLFEGGSTLDNGGTVIAKDSGTIEFLHAGTVVNEPGSNSGGVETAPGEIESTGAAIIFTDTDLDNFGGVTANSFGTITFSGATIVNEAGVPSGEDASPGGEIEATNDGLIGITGGKIVNEAGATLDAEFGG
ncbi:MAG TPA: FecR family protein, partial [Pirellulales bacterium]|nr:FecR family protein [Pirellulales bacterium]